MRNHFSWKKSTRLPKSQQIIEHQTALKQSEIEFQFLSNYWEKLTDPDGKVLFTGLTEREKLLRAETRKKWKETSKAYKEIKGRTHLDQNMCRTDYLLKDNSILKQAKELLDVESTLCNTLNFRKTCHKHYRKQSFLTFLQYARIFDLQYKQYKEEEVKLQEIQFKIYHKIKGFQTELSRLYLSMQPYPLGSKLVKNKQSALVTAQMTSHNDGSVQGAEIELLSTEGIETIEIEDLEGAIQETEALLDQVLAFINPNDDQNKQFIEEWEAKFQEIETEFNDFSKNSEINNETQIRYNIQYLKHRQRICRQRIEALVLEKMMMENQLQKLRSHQNPHFEHIKHLEKKLSGILEEITRVQSEKNAKSELLNEILKDKPKSYINSHPYFEDINALIKAEYAPVRSAPESPLFGEYFIEAGDTGSASHIELFYQNNPEAQCNKRDLEKLRVTISHNGALLHLTSHELLIYRTHVLDRLQDCVEHSKNEYIKQSKINVIQYFLRKLGLIKPVDPSVIKASKERYETFENTYLIMEENWINTVLQRLFLRIQPFAIPMESHNTFARIPELEPIEYADTDYSLHETLRHLGFPMKVKLLKNSVNPIVESYGNSRQRYIYPRDDLSPQRIKVYCKHIEDYVQNKIMEVKKNDSLSHKQKTNQIAHYLKYNRRLHSLDTIACPPSLKKFQPKFKADPLLTDPDILHALNCLPVYLTPDYLRGLNNKIFESSYPEKDDSGKPIWLTTFKEKYYRAFSRFIQISAIRKPTPLSREIGKQLHQIRLSLTEIEIASKINKQQSIDPSSIGKHILNALNNQPYASQYETSSLKIGTLFLNGLIDIECENAFKQLLIEHCHEKLESEQEAFIKKFYSHILINTILFSHVDADLRRLPRFNYYCPDQMMEWYYHWMQKSQGYLSIDLQLLSTLISNKQLQYSPRNGYQIKIHGEAMRITDNRINEAVNRYLIASNYLTLCEQYKIESGEHKRIRLDIAKATSKIKSKLKPYVLSYDGSVNLYHPIMNSLAPADLLKKYRIKRFTYLIHQRAHIVSISGYDEQLFKNITDQEELNHYQQILLSNIDRDTLTSPLLIWILRSNDRKISRTLHSSIITWLFKCKAKEKKELITSYINYFNAHFPNTQFNSIHEEFLLHSHEKLKQLIASHKTLSDTADNHLLMKHFSILKHQNSKYKFQFQQLLQAINSPERILCLEANQTAMKIASQLTDEQICTLYQILYDKIQCYLSHPYVINQLRYHRDVIEVQFTLFNTLFSSEYLAQINKQAINHDLNKLLLQLDSAEDNIMKQDTNLLFVEQRIKFLFDDDFERVKQDLSDLRQHPHLFSSIESLLTEEIFLYSEKTLFGCPTLEKIDKFNHSLSKIMNEFPEITSFHSCEFNHALAYFNVATKIKIILNDSLETANNVLSSSESSEKTEFLELCHQISRRLLRQYPKKPTQLLEHSIQGILKTVNLSQTLRNQMLQIFNHEHCKLTFFKMPLRSTATQDLKIIISLLVKIDLCFHQFNMSSVNDNYFIQQIREVKHLFSKLDQQKLKKKLKPLMDQFAINDDNVRFNLT